MADDLVQEQIDYYRARAGEYDEWFYRLGRFNHGTALNARWFAEVEIVSTALETFGPNGAVLELACGTGLWTQRLIAHAMKIIAVDAAPEVLAINKARVHSSIVTYVQANLFTWMPSANAFDVVFFSFWLSHVPPDRFNELWHLVRRALRPGGRFFFIDSRYEPTSTAVDHRLPNGSTATMTRRLNDGREFTIVKSFYDGGSLRTRLGELGFTAEIHQTPTYFQYGSGRVASGTVVGDS